MTGLGSNLVIIGIGVSLGIILWLFKKAMCDEIDWGEEDSYLHRGDD